MIHLDRLRYLWLVSLWLCPSPAPLICSHIIEGLLAILLVPQFLFQKKHLKTAIMSNYGHKTDDYPKLSRLFESMRSEYDVVVIGSGYGAAVAASRMARAGKSVAVLELGWERRCKYTSRFIY